MELSKKRKQNYDSHDWTTGNEINWCKKCGQTAWNLGFAGDGEEYMPWGIPCPENDRSGAIALYPVPVIDQRGSEIKGIDHSTVIPVESIFRNLGAIHELGEKFLIQMMRICPAGLERTKAAEKITEAVMWAKASFSNR